MTKRNAWQTPILKIDRSLEHPLELSQALSVLSRRLASHSETPALDAQVLAAQTLGKSRSWVLAHPEVHISPTQLGWLDLAAQRLEAGEPLPYVLGKWEFYGLSFSISPAVLIPRPETELLVEQALTWCRGRNENRPLIADIGTGSGCIAISLAYHLPDTHLIASDLSEAALRVARQNVHQHQVASQVALIQADLLAPFAHASFDLICANLPYIPTSILRQLAVSASEPTLALDGGIDGLDILRRFLGQIENCVKPGGLLLAEIEATQGPVVLETAQRMFPTAKVSIHPDLAGKDRLLSVHLR